MGFFNKVFKFIANASMPTYKFENNQIAFKTNTENYLEYDLGNYDMKTRHDPFVFEAYTISNEELFLEYVKTDNNTSWNGQAVSLYEDFFKSKLKLNSFETLEKKELGNYIFKVKKVNENFVLHLIYIWTVSTNIFIVDMKGNLYKKLLSELDSNYEYNFEKEEKASVNFNISIVKDNCLQGFFNASN